MIIYAAQNGFTVFFFFKKIKLVSVQSWGLYLGRIKRKSRVNIIKIPCMDLWNSQTICKKYIKKKEKNIKMSTVKWLESLGIVKGQLGFKPQQILSHLEAVSEHTNSCGHLPMFYGHP